VSFVSVPLPVPLLMAAAKRLALLAATPAAVRSPRGRMAAGGGRRGRRVTRRLADCRLDRWLALSPLPPPRWRPPWRGAASVNVSAVRGIFGASGGTEEYPRWSNQGRWLDTLCRRAVGAVR